MAAAGVAHMAGGILKAMRCEAFSFHVQSTHTLGRGITFKSPVASHPARDMVSRQERASRNTWTTCGYFFVVQAVER